LSSGSLAMMNGLRSKGLAAATLTGAQIAGEAA